MEVSTCFLKLQIIHMTFHRVVGEALVLLAQLEQLGLLELTELLV
jgi:hypothetical protein